MACRNASKPVRPVYPRGSVDYFRPARRPADPKAPPPRPETTSKERHMSTHETIPPHGGTLVNLQLPDAEARDAAEEAQHLPKVAIGDRELSDLEMMSVGALSPLTGFMGEKDYWSVIRTMPLENGLPWTIPVGLSLSEEEAKRVGGASRIALV